MKKTLTGRGWLMSFAAGMLVVLIAMSILMYAIDPFFQFRVRDNTYALDGRFVNAGLIKNYDYDTLIVGSSMTQNFHAKAFREEMGAEALHVNMGGMTPEEIVELINLSTEVGKAKHVIANISLATFGQNGESKNPSYLLEDGFGAFIQYVLSYEAWFRYLPTIVRLGVQQLLGFDLSQATRRSMEIDYLGNFEHMSEFDEAIVLRLYHGRTVQAGSEDASESYAQIVSGVDAFFESLQPSDAQISFFFPPYSALYWLNQGDRREFQLDAKEYFVQEATKRGFTVFDFQSAEFITDLNNYMDLTHYSGEINDWMTACFAKGEYIATPDNTQEYRQQLYARIDELQEKYAGRL